MENRDRDKVSHSTGPTDAGNINREVDGRRGQDEQGIEFGQNIGEAENLEPNSRREPSERNGAPSSSGEGKDQTNNGGASGTSEGRH